MGGEQEEGEWLIPVFCFLFTLFAEESACKPVFLVLLIRCSIFFFCSDDADGIKGIGGFGKRHTDVRDLLAGLSNLLSLSKIPNTFHPGLMIMLCLGIARRLDAFTSFFMCGLHVHAGTTPTFSEEMQDLMKPDCTRLLNILYMSSAVMGGEGPVALAPLAPGSLLQVSREYQDPT